MDETIKKLVQELKKFTPPFIEKNIFSIGGRGHYENPISDILSFFIDPQDQHGMGDVFLRAFFHSLDECPETLHLNSTPRREELTKTGNRLDIVIESDNWILVIENKTVNLTPGMAVTVEIKTGKRRVMEYFLSPLMEYQSESFKER